MNILLVRVSSLGDVLHNMPIVADIKRHFPDANIDWVVEEGYVSLVRLNPMVRHILPWGLRRWRKSLGKKETRAEIGAFFRQLREVQYDYVFDTQGLLKTGVIMGAARGRNKVGLANGSEGSGYEGISRIFHSRSIPLDPRTHAVARGRLVVGAALGFKVDYPADFGLPEVPAGEARPYWMGDEPYAVFFHGTARDAKKWAPANWTELGRALAPMPVLLPWGSDKEKAEAQALAAGIPNARVLPKLQMADAVMLARRAALAVGVDTGLTHIAAAFSRPVVEIYADSPRWKTEGNWSPRIINLGDKGSPPGVPEVLAAAKSLL
ncbi:MULTISPECIES: lipopolysaccharide heptosyltransferase I [unclassified Duganella]|uniref:lipopolysaccharide heptosyltransferase I n=1 Tax=unclassified Duganella TaxID=2636909 RepID=UPI00070151CA|nr:MULTISPECIES: lipopolysaccharide heptosyltransferase I [unclassified Duganella]KQV53797.1 ADP-heptose--LPS heptosyltransferase [Duganella sp. Root336D2]KRB83648.1 ADP-heptose--LPS heptosyltransferase [Duganella sp. Root198D2]